MTGRPRDKERRVVDYTAAGNKVQHGVKKSYSVHGCRCILCTDAKQKADAEYYAKYPDSRRRKPEKYAPPLLGLVTGHNRVGMVIGHDLSQNRAHIAWQEGGSTYVPWSALREKKSEA